MTWADLFPFLRASEQTQTGGRPEANRPFIGDCNMNIIAEADMVGKWQMGFTCVREMTPAEWARVADNPRQRDTEGRARRAKHLREFHPAHCMTNAARLPDGSLIKLDGHTRSYLWNAGKLQPPAKLHVALWDCASIEDAKELYRMFDSRDAVETISDQMFGGTQELGLNFQSELLKSRRYAGALRVVHDMMEGNAKAASRTSRDEPVYDLIAAWVPELEMLDTCEPTRKRFSTGVTAAALITFRRYGASASDFWALFAKGKGTKIGEEMDAVHALEYRIEQFRLKKQLAGAGNYYNVICVALSAFEGFHSNKIYTSGVRAIQSNALKKWLTATRKAKRAE